MSLATRIGGGLLGFVLVLVVWTAGARYAQLTRTDLDPEVIIRLYPSPDRVLAAALELSPRDVAYQVALSSGRVFLGFFAAAAVALPLGFLIGRVQTAAIMLEPANDFLRYLPVAGFGTLTIFLLGTGDKSAVLVVFIGTVFHLVVATADAVRRVPPAYLDIVHSIYTSWFQRVRYVIAPAAAPAVFDNLRIAVGWAWSYVTLAEIMGTQGGLGYAIEVSRRYVRTDQVLLWLVIVGLLGLTSDQLMRLLSRRWFQWV